MWTAAWRFGPLTLSEMRKPRDHFSAVFLFFGGMAWFGVNSSTNDYYPHFLSRLFELFVTGKTKQKQHTVCDFSKLLSSAVEDYGAFPNCA